MSMPTEQPSAMESLLALMRAADTDERRFPATIVYCENWLLRLTLRTLDLGIPELAPGLRGGSRWFSEARLYSPFLRRSRSGSNGEGFTQADAVVGDFTIRAGTKAGITLLSTASTFSVMEAKIFSPLSAGTKNAFSYDQAARNVACIAETIRRAGLRPENFDHLGFFVAAPESQFRGSSLESLVTADSIRQAVVSRAASYDGQAQRDHEAWVTNWLEPTLAKIQLSCISWESLIERIAAWNSAYAGHLGEYYCRCLQYN